MRATTLCATRVAWKGVSSPACLCHSRRDKRRNCAASWGLRRHSNFQCLLSLCAPRREASPISSAAGGGGFFASLIMVQDSSTLVRGPQEGQGPVVAPESASVLSEPLQEACADTESRHLSCKPPGTQRLDFIDFSGWQEAPWAGLQSSKEPSLPKAQRGPRPAASLESSGCLFER